MQNNIEKLPITIVSAIMVDVIRTKYINVMN